jgi:hypothetical protein
MQRERGRGSLYPVGVRSTFVGESGIRCSRSIGRENRPRPARAVTAGSTSCYKRVRCGRDERRRILITPDVPQLGWWSFNTKTASTQCREQDSGPSGLAQNWVNKYRSWSEMRLQLGGSWQITWHDVRLTVDARELLREDITVSRLMSPGKAKGAPSSTNGSGLNSTAYHRVYAA